MMEYSAEKSFNEKAVIPLLDEMKDLAFLVKNIQGDFLYVYANKALLAVFPGSPVGKRVTDVESAGKEGRIINDMKKVLQSGESEKIEDMYLFKDGIRAVEISLSPVANGEHANLLLGVIWPMRWGEKALFMNSHLEQSKDSTANLELDDTVKLQNMSELIKVKEELAISEERYEIFFSKNPLAVMMLSQTGEIIEANPACEKIFGFTKGKMEGSSFFTYLSYDLPADEMLTSFQRFVLSQKQELQLLFNHADGSSLECMVTFVRPSGTSNQVYVMIRDMTKEKQAGRNLERSIKELEDLKKAVDQSLLMEITDPHGVILDVNKRFEEISQFSRRELIGNSHRLINSGYHDKEFFDDMWSTVKDGRIWSGEIRNRAKNGDYFWVNSTIIPQKNEKRELESIIAISSEITEKKNLQLKLIKREEMLSLITENANDLILLLDRDGTISYASPSHQPLLGFCSNDLIGQNPHLFIADSHMEKWDYHWNSMKDECRQVSFEILFCSKDKEEHWMEAKATSVLGGTSESDQVIVIAREINDRKKLEEKLTFLAFHDTLTNLPNRSFIRKIYPTLIADKNEEANVLSVLFIDGDGFKEVNDVYGHDVGDEFIKKFGEVLLNSVRKDDVVARLGGDEFLVVLTHKEGEDDYESAVNRIQENIRKGWTIKGVEFRVSASIGVSMYPQHGREIEQLIAKADEAMYEAKRRGKNQIKVAE